MNIVEIILKLLGSGDTLTKISSLLGIGQDQAGKAIGAAVPTLLAGLMGSAAKPEGAAQLSNLLSSQPPGALDDLSGLLSNAASSGAGQPNPLASLLGSSGLGQIAGVLSKFTGVNEGGMGKLLGLLAPVMLGAIGKQAKGLDAAGLTAMLAGQKDNVTAALPAGLGNMLSSAVPGLGNMLGGATQAAATATRSAATATHHAEAAKASFPKWLFPLILAGAAAFLLPKMCRKTGEVVDQGPVAVDQTLSAVNDSTAFVGDASSLIKDATAAAITIKDEASATAALPKLKEINAKLGGLQELWAKLPAPAQSIAADALRPLIAKLRETVQPLLNLPVVGNSLKPTVDEMFGALDTFIAKP